MIYLLLGPESWGESVTTFGCPQLAPEKQLFGTERRGEPLARGMVGGTCVDAETRRHGTRAGRTQGARLRFRLARPVPFGLRSQWKNDPSSVTFILFLLKFLLEKLNIWTSLWK